jgi:Protein of unknown function DUF262/Protein of unknown function (DUF1524)
MKPDKLTVHDIFQRERRYVVPLYQRSYVWNREEQWEPLWEDIEHHAQACLTAENHVARRSHFLGAIVLNVAKIVGSSVARSEIIDGQQRLTTLQVLLAALRDYAVEIGSEHAGKLTRLTINEDEKPGSEGSFKVWPTNTDRILFRNVLTAKSPPALIKALNIESEADAPRLAAAYLYFAKVIREFVRQGIDDSDLEKLDHRILGLIQAQRTALQFIVIELEENDDPQVIFETLNARGQPLLPSDLIRNLIFLQAANAPNTNADELYEQYWRSFDDRRQKEAVNGEDRFWHIQERQGRLTRPRIDLFMFHYLVMKTERELNIGQLFREFRDWRDEHPQSVEGFLLDLQKSSAVFADLVAPSGRDRAAIFARRLKALDNSTVYPLLLFIMSLPRERLSVSARDEIIDDLESWLVRRFVCQLTNKNYNRFFVSLLNKIRTAPTNALLPDIVRTELTRSSEPTLNWPDDKEFKQGWLTKRIYAKSRPDRSAMILRAIEERIRTPRNEDVILPDKLTVEHLLPQKGALSDYPFAETMPLEKSENAERCRSRVIDTVGNLTLLTRELNSSVSNGAFSGKSEAIAADSDLRLNAWLRFGSVTKWSEDSIIARGEDLFETASMIWPRRL